MLVATAGHVDHGKSTLVRALTGAETDRLPEEKMRGISIDLGFAYWRPDDGPVVGFVDVPGHERFIRNMVAGICGIDAALLVIAADDGVMPQTIEHLQILHMLGISRGWVALTKCDRVSTDLLATRVAQVEAVLAGTSLAGIEIIPVSVTSGTGLDRVATALIEARGRGLLPVSTVQPFRLAIDRSFSLAGAGTVITGSILCGKVGSGDRLVVAPQGREVRVRALQSAGLAVSRAEAGQRVAINLSGIDATSLRRGDWLVAIGHAESGIRLAAAVTMLPSLARPLRPGTPVHLLIGTAHVEARLLTPRQKMLRPDQTETVQLLLNRPVCAIAGDRFILRDASDRELLGGGQVIDPLTTTGRRAGQARTKIAEAFALPSPTERLLALAQAPGFELDLRWFARCWNLARPFVESTAKDCGLQIYGREAHLAVAPGRLELLETVMVSQLAEHHQAQSASGGLNRREIRARLGEPVSTDLLSLLVDRLAASGRIAARGPLIHLPGHVPRFSAAEAEFWRKMLAIPNGDGPCQFVLADVARELQVSEAIVAGMCQRRRLSGELCQISPTRYMLREHVSLLAALAARIDTSSDSGLTAADLRDASKLGRNFIIQLLEFFDRIGVTRRSGDLRRVNVGWQAIVGQPGEAE